MNKISLKIGSKVYYENKEYEISNQISTKEILGKEVEFPYEFKVLKIQNLKSKPDTKEIDISLFDKKEWGEANKKYEIIKPFLHDKRNNKKETFDITQNVYSEKGTYLQVGLNKEEDYETKITKSIYQTSSTLELNKSELIRILKKMD